MVDSQFKAYSVVIKMPHDAEGVNIVSITTSVETLLGPGNKVVEVKVLNEQSIAGA